MCKVLKSFFFFFFVKLKKKDKDIRRKKKETYMSGLVGCLFLFSATPIENTENVPRTMISEHCMSRPEWEMPFYFSLTYNYGENSNFKILNKIIKRKEKDMNERTNEWMNRGTYSLQEETQLDKKNPGLEILLLGWHFCLFFLFLQLSIITLALHHLILSSPLPINLCYQL